MPAASPGRPRQRTQCCCRRRLFPRAQVLPSLLVWNCPATRGEEDRPRGRCQKAKLVRHLWSPWQMLQEAYVCNSSVKPLLAPHLHSSGAQIHGSARAELDHPGLTPESFPAPGGHVTVLVKLLLHTDPTDFPSSTSRHEQKGSDFPSLCVPCCETPSGSRSTFFLRNSNCRISRVPRGSLRCFWPRLLSSRSALLHASFIYVNSLRSNKESDWC